MVYSSITFSAVALLKAGDDMGFAALCVISGLASGAEITMPFTIARTITAIRGAGNSGKRPWLTLAGVAKLAALIGCAPALLFIENPPILGAAWIVPLYVGVPCVLKLVAVMGWSRWIKQNGGEYEKNTLHGDVHAA
jgi:GPH family glycoside/pentoside/hexuronide:cation symporter